MTVEKRYPTAEDAIRGKKEDLIKSGFVEISKDLFVDCTLYHYPEFLEPILCAHICKTGMVKENSGGFLIRDSQFVIELNGLLSCVSCKTTWNKKILDKARLIRAMKEFNRGKMGKDRT